LVGRDVVGLALGLGVGALVGCVGLRVGSGVGFLVGRGVVGVRAGEAKPRAASKLRSWLACAAPGRTAAIIAIATITRVFRISPFPLLLSALLVFGVGVVDGLLFSAAMRSRMRLFGAAASCSSTGRR
jgi:hypothetical protein